MHAISSYRGNRPTNTKTHKQTHRQDRLQYTAPQLPRSVIINKVIRCTDANQLNKVGCMSVGIYSYYTPSLGHDIISRDLPETPPPCIIPSEPAVLWTSVNKRLAVAHKHTRIRVLSFLSAPFIISANEFVYLPLCVFCLSAG